MYARVVHMDIFAQLEPKLSYMQQIRAPGTPWAEAPMELNNFISNGTVIQDFTEIAKYSSKNLDKSIGNKEH